MTDILRFSQSALWAIAARIAADWSVDPTVSVSISQHALTHQALPLKRCEGHGFEQHPTALLSSRNLYP
jgi:hypothetical protein